MLYVVSYDISDDKKRNRVHGVLMDYGFPVQYSVFECELNHEKLAAMIGELKPLVARGDSVRLYRICSSCMEETRVI